MHFTLAAVETVKRTGETDPRIELVLGKKMMLMAVSYIFEDWIQSSCQYFYFEKYQTSLSIFPIFNGMIMLLMGGILLKTAIFAIKKAYRKTGTIIKAVVPISIACNSIIRLALLMYQGIRPGMLLFIRRL